MSERKDHKASNLNVVVVGGVVASPQPWEDQSRRLLRFELVCHGEHGRERVPVSWELSPETDGPAEGSKVLVVGRVRTRFFRSGSATHSRTEVVADAVVSIRKAKLVSTALDGAVERIRRS